MEKHEKIYIAGHLGMVGSAMHRKLIAEGFNNIIVRTSAELDLTNQQAVADFFVVCQASSSTQVKAIADHVEYQVKQLCSEVPYRREGAHAAQWVLVDYVNVVVHIFHPDTRKFYRLEEMWSDAVLTEHT
jgi:ribosome silencing factor RsfS/YbeB/iojap